MMSKNSVLLIGRIVKKPTITGDGDKKISRTSVRVSSGGNTNVFPVVAFGKNAETLYRLGDYGMGILIDGRMEMRQREIDANTKIPFISIVMDSFNVYDTHTQRYNDQESQVDYSAEPAEGTTEE